MPFSNSFSLVLFISIPCIICYVSFNFCFNTLRKSSSVFIPPAIFISWQILLTLYCYDLISCSLFVVSLYARMVSYWSFATLYFAIIYWYFDCFSSSSSMPFSADSISINLTPANYCSENCRLSLRNMVLLREMPIKLSSLKASLDLHFSF